MKGRVITATIVFMLLISACPWTVPGGEVLPETRGLDFTEYMSYAEVKDMLIQLTEEHPDITDLRVLGKTYEGRDIMALRVTDNPDIEEDEPDVLIMGAHHAEELPSAEVPLYVLDFLVNNYDSNGSARRLVDTRDIWFVPLLNPDGRDYVLNGSANWRKNRRSVDLDSDGTPEGYGVDLNRNYGHRWGELPGTSHNVNDRDYCGPEAFSENETRAIRDLAYGQLFEVSLSYHTYGNVIFYPWNNNMDAASPRSDMLEAIASEMGERTGYATTRGSDPPLGYPTTGDSDDWLHADTNCLAFTVEVGTTYQPPIGQLKALCEQNLVAALYAIEVAGEPERALLPDWTFMAYLAADPHDPFDGIIDAALDDLNEMEVSGSTADVNIIALYDSLAYGDSDLYRISKDPDGLNDTLVSQVLNDYGAIIDPVTRELDMSDPQTLRAFAEWTTDNYPAQHYCLDIWGHGRGILRGFASDKTNTMQTREINQALSGFHLDVVGFDACSMGHFETAHELAGICDYFIGSEAEEPISGWDYEASISKLVSTPNISPRELSDIIVSDYLTRNYNKDYITQTAVDLYIYRERFLPLLGDVLNVSFDFIHHDLEYFWEARNFTDDTYLTSRDTVDLFEYLGKLAELDISEPLAERISTLKSMRESLIVNSGHGFTHTGADSMAVYFPSAIELANPVASEYADLAFNTQLWDEFLGETKSPTQAPRFLSFDSPALDNITGPYAFTAEAEPLPDIEVELNYRLNGGSWLTLPMIPSSGTYSCTLAGQPNGTVIDYYFTASIPGREVTEPYEMKLTGDDYYRIVVTAYCDVAVSDIVVSPNSGIHNNTNVTITVECVNLGPQDAHINVTLSLMNDSQSLELGWERFLLASGSARSVTFAWVALNGTWLASAASIVEGKEDINETNQNSTLWIEVTPLAVNTEGSGLGDLVYVLVFLMIMTSIPVLAFIFLFRRARLRRRVGIARSLRSARQLIATAGEFDVDTTSSYLLLARAEVALSNGSFDEAERLANEAKEVAILAVGGQRKT
jgi:hypothetical protein